MSWMIWWGLMEGRRRLRGLSSAVLMAVEIVEIMGSLISGGRNGGGEYHGRVAKNGGGGVRRRRIVKGLQTEMFLIFL